MDEQSLLDLLDIKAAPVPDAAVKEEPVEIEVVSDSALVLDEWDENRGKELRQKSPVMAQMTRTDKEAADFHALAYQQEPALHDHCTDPRRREFVDGVLNHPDTRAARLITVHDQMLSEMAACTYATGYDTLRKADEAQKKLPPPKTKTEASMREAQDAADMSKMVSHAAEGAAQEVQEADDFLRGCGRSDGTPGARPDRERLAKLFKRVRNNGTLRRIFNLAGRFRRAAQGKQRRRAVHGYDDLVGVEQAGDVGRLLPGELGRLGHPLLKLDVMRRLVDHQAQCRDHRSPQPEGKGPVVVCVDESGSMEGEPFVRAKAFALAMAWVARSQKRWCCLIGYTGSTNSGEKGHILTLKPGGWDEAKLVEWLETNKCGGSGRDIPIVELPTEYWKKINPPKGKTDVIFVTDASLYQLQDDVVKTFNDWRAAERVTLRTLLIDHGSTKIDQLQRICEIIHVQAEIDVGLGGVDECLSL